MKFKHIITFLLFSLTLSGCQISKSYTVTWENYDGTVLETDSVTYGSTPTYDGATPSKDGTDQYTYTFSGWSPSVVAVTSDATYIAQFSSAINSYTITWENYDGTVLETDSVTYGSTPTYDGATPSKDGTDQYTYTFSGWSPSVVAVTSDATYIAQFSSAINSYTITWKNYDDTTLEVDEGVAYGSMPSYDGATPVKSGSAQFTYSFSGWSPEVSLVMGNATYTAEFSSSTNNYTITWKNYDDTTLEVDEGVAYGSMPSYDGATPVKSGSAQFTYSFSGWSPEVSLVMGNATYTAEFSSSTNNYTITWKNYDDTTLEVDEGVAYGSMPSYDGATPIKDDSAFSGWSPAVTSVSGNQTYTAQFNEIENGLKKGDIYQFGSYPQTKVTDSSLISTLTTAAGTLPTSANAQAWTSYDYYIEGSVSSYMWYIDLVNGVDEYRGVYFTSYRPYDTTRSSSAGMSLQDDNAYYKSNVYWFKYQPITWRVLDVQSDEAFLMANLILDSQDYYYSTYNRTINSTTVYANNYEYSNIRSWLNDTFYNTAFKSSEQVKIETTTVDNGVTSTGFSPNSYAGADTSDKIFLLSYVEATSVTYNLNIAANRKLQGSDYAKSQGFISGWWLRSPNINNSFNSRYVLSDGGFSATGVFNTFNGVAPALWISI